MATVSGQPSATVTMLFSDMEGSTALLSQLGDEYVSVLSRQRALLRAIWRRLLWGGSWSLSLRSVNLASPASK